jgi:hypothetical protein
MPDLLRRSPCGGYRDLRRTIPAAGAGIAKSSARIYRISLTTWGWMLTGEPAPTGPARRGAKPPAIPVAAIAAPAPPHRTKALAENQIAAL